MTKLGKVQFKIELFKIENELLLSFSNDDINIGLRIRDVL